MEFGCDAAGNAFSYKISFYGCGDLGLASLSHAMKNPVMPYLKKWGEVLSPDDTCYCKETEAFG